MQSSSLYICMSCSDKSVSIVLKRTWLITSIRTEKDNNLLRKSTSKDGYLIIVGSFYCMHTLCSVNYSAPNTVFIPTLD